MRARPAQVQAAHRRAVGAGAGRRAQQVELVERHLAMEDVAANEAEHALEVGRCEHLVVQHRAGHVRGELPDHVHDAPEIGLALRLPAALGELVGRELGVERQRVVAGARGHQGVVVGRVQATIDERAGRGAAVLGVVPGPLDLLDALVEHELAEHPRPVLGALEARELRRLPQHAIDLHDRRARPVGAHLVGQLGRQVAIADQVEQGRARVAGREHDVRVELLAALELHARRAAAAHPDLLHHGLGADLGARRARARGDRLADRAHAAAHDPPAAAHARDLADHVVHQHVGRAGCLGAGPGADHARAAQRGERLFVREPLAQVVRHRQRHQIGQRRQAAIRGPAAQAGARPIGDIARSADAGGRRAQEQRAQHRRKVVERALVVRVGMCVGRRMGGELRGEALVVHPLEQVALVAPRVEHGRIEESRPRIRSAPARARARSRASAATRRSSHVKAGSRATAPRSPRPRRPDGGARARTRAARHERGRRPRRDRCGRRPRRSRRSA